MINCTKCGKQIKEGVNFCCHCGEKARQPQEVAENYRDIKGIWSVSTYGDAEGRSTTQLGVYNGFVDEIALYLADYSVYELCFRKISDLPVGLPVSNTVTVKFDIESNTWDMTSQELVNNIAPLFRDRPVKITARNDTFTIDRLGS